VQVGQAELVRLPLVVAIQYFQQSHQLVAVVAELAVALEQTAVQVVAQVVTRLVQEQEQQIKVMRVGTVTQMDIRV
jgi:hypothetical protein